MARWQEQPMIGQTVWCMEFGNGVVHHVNYEDSEVLCNFYEKGFHMLELDLFFGAFDEGLNQWVIPEPA